MKLFKRIAAGLLACAMALSMAACGGGGGGGGGGSSGSSTAKTKLANTPLATGGSVTLESVDNDDSNTKIKFGSNGTSLYVRDTESGVDIVYLKNSSGIYAIDMTQTNKTAQNVSSDSGVKVLMGLFEAMLNAKDDLTNAQNGQIEISGKTYDSAIITTKVEGVSYDIAYCFDGDTLKYIAVFNSSSSNAFLTLAVNSVNGSVDSSLLTTNGWTSGGTTKPTENVTVSLTASGSGSVSGGGTYTKGSSVTVAAAPSSGYTFAGWQKNGTTVSTSASYTFTASESVALTAVFKAQTAVSYKDYFNKFTSGKFYFKGTVNGYTADSSYNIGSIFVSGAPIEATSDGTIGYKYTGQYAVDGGEWIEWIIDRSKLSAGTQGTEVCEYSTNYNMNGKWQAGTTYNASAYEYNIQHMYAMLAPEAGAKFVYGNDGTYDTITWTWENSYEFVYYFDSNGNLKYIKEIDKSDDCIYVYTVYTHSPVPNYNLINSKLAEAKANPCE